MYGEKYSALLKRISQKELVELTQNLIRFKSVNPPGDEMEIALFIADILEREGLEAEVIRHSESRASLVARLGGGDGPGLLYSGHLDVVPAQGTWRMDPFAGECAEGKIWGRGATDMKSGVAAMIMAAMALAREGLDLNGPLYLGFTAGEETDNYGAIETLKYYKFKPVQAVFIAEPSANEIFTAEKGALWLEIKTLGRAAHISRMEEGRNSLTMMLPILRALEEMDISVEDHPLLGDYRRSPNVIAAGKNTNTIPPECIVKIDQRTLPGQSHQEIVDRIKDMIGRVAKTTELEDFKAEVSVILDNPPLEVDYGEPALQKLIKIAAEVRGQEQEGPKGVGFFTDAVKFTPALDAPFAICGPGNPALNHQADEWVEIDKLMDSAKIYAMAGAEYLCG